MSRDGRKVSGAAGAEGIGGGEAISKRLDQLAAEGGVTSFRAMVVYLTNSEAGQAAMIAAGVDLNNRHTRSTVLGWISEPDPNASKKYRDAVERAYEGRRRQNMVRALKRRLSNNGAGTRVEVHPVNQANVPAPLRRDLNVRNVNVRPTQWDGLVDAWAAGDISGMDAIWEGIAEDVIGSEWAAYASVSSIGFSA